jgi:hypothetical protein
MAKTETTDLGQLLQLVLDAEPLAPYYHVDQAPDRKPVRIAKGPAVASEPALVKFGLPVVYEDAAQLAASGQPHFEVRKVIVNAELAYLQFAYAIEGIVGEAWFLREGGTWKLGHVSIRET